MATRAGNRGLALASGGAVMGQRIHRDEGHIGIFAPTQQALHRVEGLARWAHQRLFRAQGIVLREHILHRSTSAPQHLNTSNVPAPQPTQRARPSGTSRVTSIATQRTAWTASPNPRPAERTRLPP